MFVLQQGKYRSENYMISPRSGYKRMFDYLGLCLLLTQLFYPRSDYVCILSDIYYLIDMILRFRTGYVNSKGNVVLNPQHVVRKYLQTWFIYDLFVCFPYQIILRIWNARPVLKLLNLRSNRRPIISFLFNRKFRMETIAALREHIRERRYLQEMMLTETALLPLHRRLIKWTGMYIKGRRYMALVKDWSAVLQSIIGLVISLRALSGFVTALKHIIN